MAGSTTKISIHKDSEHKVQPSEETVAAMLEVKKIAKDPSVKGYTNLGCLQIWKNKRGKLYVL